KRRRKPAPAGSRWLRWRNWNVQSRRSERHSTVRSCPIPIRAGATRWYRHQDRRLTPMTFLNALSEQRWDDHRYYHHSRINQSLHFGRGLTFIGAYALIFVKPAAAVMLGWLVAMPSRQIGHFFFEPKGYDEANHATHQHKEDIKVGYNLRRKAVLMSV